MLEYRECACAKARTTSLRWERSSGEFARARRGAHGARHRCRDRRRACRPRFCRRSRERVLHRARRCQRRLRRARRAAPRSGRPPAGRQGRRARMARRRAGGRADHRGLQRQRGGGSAAAAGANQFRRGLRPERRPAADLAVDHPRQGGAAAPPAGARWTRATARAGDAGRDCYRSRSARRNTPCADAAAAAERTALPRPCPRLPERQPPTCALPPPPGDIFSPLRPPPAERKRRPGWCQCRPRSPRPWRRPQARGSASMPRHLLVTASRAESDGRGCARERSFATPWRHASERPPP